MGKPAARLGDQTTHGSPLLGSPCTTVLIGGQPAWRMGDQHTCPIPNAPPPAGPGTPHGPGMTTVIPDSPSMVLIGGKAAARMGDMVNEPGAVVPLPPPNPIAAGCPTVLIATMPGGGGGGGGDKDSYCAGDPVSIFDGTVFDVTTDFELQNFVPLWITRSYRSSRSKIDGEFGYGWTHDLSCSITLKNSKVVLRQGPDEKEFDLPSAGQPTIDGPSGYAVIPTEFGYVVYCKERGQLYRFDNMTASGSFVASRIEDIYGNGLHFTYSHDGRLIEVSDRANRRLVIDYNDTHISSLRVVAPSAAARLMKRFRYDENGDLVEVSTGLGHSVRFEYDDHLLVSKTLPNGYRVFWQYDEKRRCTKTWTTDGHHSYAFEFLPDYQTVVTAANGQRELVQFDDTGALIGSSDQLGPIPHGEKCVPIVSDNRVTMLFDDEGRLLKPDYDAAGRVTALHMSSGAVWRKTYDSSGAEQTVTSPENRVARYFYDDRGRQTRIENPDGTFEEWFWDEQDNVVHIRLSNGIEWVFDHDPFGNIIAQTGPSRRPTTYLLYELFRIAEERRPDGSWLKWEFNELGSAAALTSSTGYRTVFERNGVGQIERAATLGPGGILVSESRFDFDPIGMVRAIRSLEGELFARRDVRARITSLTRTDGSEIKCEYDSANRLRQAILPTVRQTLHYNDAGDVVNVTFSDGTQIVTERYPDGRLKSLKEDLTSRQITVIRDLEGNVTGDKTAAGDVSYPLTAGHNVASIAIDGEPLSRFEWEGDVLSSIHAFGNSVHLLSDIPRYQLQTVFQNGVTQRRKFAPNGQLLSESTTDASGNRLLEFEYRYQPDGRLSSINDDGVETRFRYDPAGRLTRFENSRASELYSYDARSNLINTPWNGSHNLDEHGRIIRAGKESLNYDASGRLTDRVRPSGTVRYSYDVQDRLIRVVLENGKSIEYQYDLIGRRIEKRTDDAVIRFTWAGPTMVRESHFDASGEILRKQIRYTYFAGAQLPAMREDTQYQDGEAEVRVYFYHLDGRGVPRALTDELGRVVWSAEFDAWRGIRSTSGDIEQPLRFPGHYLDSETGLHYTIARYYDPTLGRFLNPSLGDEIAGYGAVVYCYADPVNLVDTTGENPVGGVLWIQGQLKTAFETAVQLGAGNNLTGSQLGKFVDGQMSKSIEDLNKNLQGMGSRNRVIDQAQRFEEFDPKNPSKGWGRGKPPYPESKIADAIIVEMACDFTKASPTYKDGQKGAIKKIHRGYDWSVGQPENLANDQAKYAELFTEGSTRRFQMWDANNGSVAGVLRGAGII